MIELAQYKKGYGRLPGFITGMAIIVVTTALFSAGLNLWLHTLWMACINLLTVAGVLPGLFIHGFAYLQVRRRRPPIWIGDDTLYAVSPLHFQIRMGDIACWRVSRHSWNGTMQHHLVLTNRKGKQRSINLNFVDDRDLLAVRLTHILGPQTHPALADATAGA